jgi:hypothetical protein
MSARLKSSHRSALKPLLVVGGAIVLFIYGTVALLSQDAKWFLGRAEVPEPNRIVIRVDGDETVLTPASAHYDVILVATRKTLSAFRSWAPGSMGLSDRTLAEYQTDGTILEFYFDDVVEFHLPFPDGNPTALVLPMKGRLGGEGHVFRGKNGRWWAGNLTVSDPQPLVDALVILGYMQQ